MRFLKKEWDDTQVPGQALSRARNRAWKRIQEGAQRSERRLWLVGAAAAAGGLCLIWLLWPAAGTPLPSPLPAAQPPQPQIVLKQPLAPQPVVRDGRDVTGGSQDWLASDAGVAPPALPERAGVSEPEPARKMIFRLPRSGVRLIWMTQTSQTSEGE
ncbi:MAG TPA: hypothetical protein VLU25_15055 [Acidobacteriota bacterium]|nr:hypothetical protein [Acidobacteriota bacterium]